ncbi:MAG: CNNM domain-containing protein [Balneolaceae bacterium]
MFLLIVYLLLAIGVSFLCSILEAVFLSISPTYITVLESKEDRAGKLLRELKNDVDRPLAAILSLNTVAHTIGAAGVGAQSQIVFGNAYVTITSIVLTLLILVLSEIIPKTLGATYWKELSGISARTIKLLIVLTYPFVLLSRWISSWLSNKRDQPTFSREEFSAMAEQGMQEGIIEEGESKIFKNLIRFNSLKVKDIMTPRVVVVRFPQSSTVGDVLQSVDKQEINFSRLPVFEKSDEDITGYVLKDDLLLHGSRGNLDTRLEEIRRDILIIPELISIKHLMERLLESQEQIAVAVDEYGGFSGVVSMEDVVETLLGMEIVDEADSIDDMQKLAREKWKRRAERLGIVIPGSDKPN